MEKGDTVYLAESPEGVSLTPYDPAFERQVEAAREIHAANAANVLHELAK